LKCAYFDRLQAAIILTEGLLVSAFKLFIITVGLVKNLALNKERVVLICSKEVSGRNLGEGRGGRKREERVIPQTQKPNFSHGADQYIRCMVR